MHFVALSSSRGTTLQAILERIDDGSLSMECFGLIADRADRGCVAKAKAVNLPVLIVSKKQDETRENYDKRLDTAIRSLISANVSIGADASTTILAAVGWLYLFSPWFVHQWRCRIINVHPSLLPKYPGLHAHEEVLAAGDKESGMTIHVIEEGLDSGKILVQKTCPVLPGDTPESLKKRVQELEKEWYPKVLEMIEQGETQLFS